MSKNSSLIVGTADFFKPTVKLIYVITTSQVRHTFDCELLLDGGSKVDDKYIPDTLDQQVGQ